MGDGNFVTKNCATFSGDVDITNNKIVNLANPTSNKDAVNKLYVDTNTANLSSFTNVIGKFTKKFTTQQKIHNKLVRVLSTDMSKALDSLHSPLLIAKLRAYGFSDEASLWDHIFAKESAG